MLQILMTISVPIVLCSAAMFFLVVIDTISGIYAAKKCGEAIKSKILRRVLLKLAKYSGLQLVGGCFDIIILLSSITNIAFATLLFTLMNASVELYSIFENYKKIDGVYPNEKMKELANDVKNNKEALETLGKILTKQQ